jgi:hypothetical protein
MHARAQPPHLRARRLQISSIEGGGRQAALTVPRNVLTSSLGVAVAGQHLRGGEDAEPVSLAPRCTSVTLDDTW